VKGSQRRPAPIGERLLTLLEAAAFLRLHPRTVRDYIRRGELSGRLIGRCWRFPPAGSRGLL
jgi:excisionase family DNA binding protein